jgi:phosphoribosylaminoimidazole (AIR) synthetase
MNKTVKVHYTDGETGTFVNAFIYSYSDGVLVIKQDGVGTHFIPQRSYALASEIIS